MVCAETREAATAVSSEKMLEVRILDASGGGKLSGEGGRK